MFKRMLCLFLLVMLLSGCGPEEETVVPEFVLTYAENQPEDYPTTLAAKEFARLVEERTEGKVIIQVKCNGEFGSEQEVIAQMHFGGIDFARVSLSSVSDEFPMLNVLQLPYLYRNSTHMWQVLDGQMGKDFLEVFSEGDLVGLSWYDSGARSFYSTTPITCADDLKDKRIRVQNSQMMFDMVTLLGAEPVNIPYSDVYSAFETDQIDMAENNWPSYQSQFHYQLAPFYTIDQHTRVPEVQLASKRTWEQLPETYREIIRQCAAESAIYQRALWEDQDIRSRANAIICGCQVIQLSEEQIQEFRRLVEPLYERYCADHMDLIARIQAG